MTREQWNLYHYIQILDFTVRELNLFLDTHPDDESALSHLSHYAKLLRKAKREYAEKYEPVTVEDVNENQNCWKWVKTPWPWEGVY